MSLNQEDESDEELPSLPFLLNDFSPCKKLDKSVDVLLHENQDLTSKIEETKNNKKIFSERLKEIENMRIEDDENAPEVMEESLVIPDTNEKLSCKHFCELNFLQFISRDDLALQKCGYDRFSAELVPFEKIMVSMEPVHLETLLSSIFSEKLCFAIKDIRSFITYLLRIISTSSEKQCINACVIILESILQDHISVEDFAFSFIEFFCPLLFNYGVDISKCPFVEIRKQIEKGSRCEDKHNSRMPEAFEYNLASLIRVLELCIRLLKFQSEDFKYMFLSLLWLGIDDNVCNEAYFESFENCLLSILCQIEEFSSDNALQVEIAEAVINAQCSSDINKWKFICKMTKIIPYALKEGIYLRKLISFNALRAMTQSFTASEDRGVKEFSLTELQSMMKFLCEMEPDNITVAVTFIDLCLKKMKFSSESEFQSLCQALKDCGTTFSQKALPDTLTYQEWARFHLELIYSRVKIMFNKEPFSHVSTTIKKEPQGFDVGNKQALPELFATNLNLQMELRPVIKNESATLLPECMIAKENASSDFSVRLPDLTVFVPSNENVFSSILNEEQNISNAPSTFTKIKTEYPVEDVSDTSNLPPLVAEFSNIASDASVVIKSEVPSPSEIIEDQQDYSYINANVSNGVGVVISNTYSECEAEHLLLAEDTSLGSPREDILHKSDASLCSLKIIETRSILLDAAVETAPGAAIEPKCTSKITDPCAAPSKEKISDSSSTEPECNLNNITLKTHSAGLINEFNSEFDSEILKTVEAVCSEIEKENIEYDTSKIKCKFTEGLEPQYERGVFEILELKKKSQNIVSDVVDLPEVNYSKSLENVDNSLKNIPVSSAKCESSEEYSIKFENLDLIAENNSPVFLKEAALPLKISQTESFKVELQQNISPGSPLNDEYDGDDVPIEEIRFDSSKMEDKINSCSDALQQCSNVGIKSTENASKLPSFVTSNTQPKIEKIKPVSKEFSSNHLDDLVVLDTICPPPTSHNKRKFTDNENSSKRLKPAEILVANNSFTQDSLEKDDLVICDSSSDSDIDIVYSCVHKNSEDCIITEVKGHVFEIVID